MIYYINKIYGVILGILSEFMLLFYQQKKNRVLISCSEGMYFNGNAKRVFEEMYTQGKDVFFITRNRVLLNELRKLYGNKVVFSYSISAMLIYLSSSKIVITHGTYDVTPFNTFHKAKKVINLWHGFPSKAIGVSLDSMSESQKKKFIKIYSNTEMMICGSKTEKNILSSSFGLEKDKIKVTGYPRIDTLIEAKEGLLDDLNIPKEKKILLYAPTYRDQTELLLFPFNDFNSEKLNVFLKNKNLILLIRLHKNDMDKLNGKIDFNENIIDLGQNILSDVNDILPYTDLLITDYSGIFIEFAVLRKSMIFIPYDYEKFIENRKMNINMINEYPGEVVSTFEEFKSQVIIYLEYNSTENKKLNKFIEKYHQYEIGSSTNKVVTLIESL